MDKRTLPLQGWDLVASTRQHVINGTLKAAHNNDLLPKVAKFSAPIDLMGTVEVDAQLGAPTVAAQKGNQGQGSYLMELNIPITGGSLKANGTTIDISGYTLSVVSSLAQIASTLQPESGGGTNYDFCVDFLDPQAVYNVDGKDDEGIGTLSVLTVALTKYLQEQLPGSYKVATVNLDKSSQKFPYLVPKSARYTYLLDEQNPDNSTFYVMMLTTGTEDGYSEFSPSLLPAGQSLMTSVSNRLFMEQMVFPAFKESIRKSLKHGKDVSHFYLTDDVPANIKNDGGIEVDAKTTPKLTNMDFKITDDGRLKLYIRIHGKVKSGPINWDTFTVKITTHYGWKVIEQNGVQGVVLTQVGDIEKDVDNNLSVISKIVDWIVGVFNGFQEGFLQKFFDTSVGAAVDTNPFRFTSDFVSFGYEKYVEITGANSPNQVNVFLNPKL